MLPVKMAHASDIPKFVINLSLPPESRYDHVVPHFRPVLDQRELPTVFSNLLRHLFGPAARWLETIAQVLLRRVYDKEESAEIRGLAKNTGIALHILIAFNVLLDLMLGCTSGGARVFDSKTSASQQATHMLHFRTLDWAMDPLRKLTVEFDHVRHRDGPVIATSVTYLGYVGVLTGVRKDLSMSLNFRPHHARDTWQQETAFRWHQAMVVLGFRRSISSVLRGFLLDTSEEKATQGPKDVAESRMDSILSDLTHSRSTAAYLIFCTPQKVFIVEKDNGHASVRDSDLFLAAHNHDASDEADPSELEHAAEGEDAIGMADIIRYSREKKMHLDHLWTKRMQTCQRRTSRPGGVVSVNDVIKMVSDDRISNDQTHYAVVMDPKQGTVIWRAGYLVDN
ncbi:Acid ceramidase [Paramyrothecium foliicola]|nr:Acid ceramidase [Paramyrothecium foliicola]